MWIAPGTACWSASFHGTIPHSTLAQAAKFKFNSHPRTSKIKFYSLPCVAIFLYSLAFRVTPSTMVARAFFRCDTLLQNRIENESVLAFAARSTQSRRWRNVCVHITTRHRLRWFAGCKNFISNCRTLLWHVTSRWIFDRIVAQCLDTLPLAAEARAELEEFLPGSDLFVARLEFHVFVNTFAHFYGDTFAIFVENLAKRTPTPLHTLQSVDLSI